MTHKRVFFLLATIILVSVTLACGVFSGGNESTDSPASQDQSKDSISPADSVEQQPDDQSSSDEPAAQSDSPLEPNPDLGDEFRSEEGGYAFQPIPGYEFEEIFGLATLIAPDADPDLGPVLMLIGGLNEVEATSFNIFNEFMNDAESEDVQILDRKEITVNGKAGLSADIAGDVDGQQVIGRLVVVAVTPTHQFTMFASAPQDRWNEIESSVDAVLQSVYFFEPQEIDFSDELEEAQPNEGSSDDSSSDEAPFLDISSLEDFPTDASELPPGGFAYLLASNQGFPTVVNEGTVQHQSTSTEYIINLVSEDQENTLTLFLPVDLEAEMYPMKYFDASSASNAPGAAVDRGSKRFINTDGIIFVDTMAENSITGSVYFSAVNEDGTEIAVTGFFNQLLLAP